MLELSKEASSSFCSSELEFGADNNNASSGLDFIDFESGCIMKQTDYLKPTFNKDYYKNRKHLMTEDSKSEQGSFEYHSTPNDSELEK